jgi:hypothetical protein
VEPEAADWRKYEKDDVRNSISNSNNGRWNGSREKSARAAERISGSRISTNGIGQWSLLERELLGNT